MKSKNIILIFVILLIANISFAQPLEITKTERQAIDLKSAKVFEYKFSFGDTVSPPKLIESYAFSQAGGMTQKTTYNNGRINSMIEIIQKTNNWHQHRYYGGCGVNLFGAYCVPTDTSDFRGVMNCYFKNENKVKAVVYDNKGKVIDKWEYEYDENNNVVKRIYYNFEKTTPKISKNLYEYSDNLLLVKKYCNFNEDTIYNTRTFQYNSKGNLIRAPVKFYNEVSYKNFTIYKYNSTNNPILSIEYNFGQHNKIIQSNKYNNNIITKRIENIYYLSETESRYLSNTDCIEKNINVDTLFDISLKNTQIADLEKTTEYYYDKNGLLTHKIEKDQTGEPIKMTKYVYKFYN